MSPIASHQNVEHAAVDRHGSRCCGHSSCLRPALHLHSAAPREVRPHRFIAGRRMTVSREPLRTSCVSDKRLSAERHTRGVVVRARSSSNRYSIEDEDSYSMPKHRSSHSLRPSASRRHVPPAASWQWMDDGPAWFTVSQLSRRWQLDRKTIYKFIDCKILPVWKVGTHLYRVAVDDIRRFEARNRLSNK